MNENYEVIVVGAGPAGSTAAGYLAMRGRRVLLLERSKFPRHHVGESLLPSMMPVLEDFGLVDACHEAGFVKKTGASFIWGRTHEIWGFEFDTTPFLPAPIAFHVDRSVFDKMLLDHAAERGAEVREEVTVTDVLKEDGRVVGVEYQVKGEDEKHRVKASFVIDASGAASVIGRRVTERVYDDKMRQTALHGYFKNVPEPEQRANHTIVENCPKGWFWAIPLNSPELGQLSLGLVTGQEFKEEMKVKGPQAFYDEALAGAPYVRNLLGDSAEQVGGLKAIRDWSYTCESTAGPGYYLAGDAASFLDPLFSPGVSLAMLAGYSASACIHTTLSNPELEEAAAGFYSNNYRQMYEVTRDFVHYFYSAQATAHPEEIFWESRKSVNLGDNIGAKQTFAFFVNTLPANPHPAVHKHIPMFLQFLENIDHPLQEGEEGGKMHEFVEDKQVLQEAAALTASSIPQVNGTLDSSFTIDRENHTLKAIRGVVYDRERAVLSSTTSWLMGRNMAPLDDEACDLLELMDGQSTWGNIVEQYTRTSDSPADQARAKAQAILDRLLAERYVLVRDNPASA